MPKNSPDYRIVFVLGGPGAGKGTQCANIVRDYGFVHLSAGDLLRAHQKSGSKDGNMVAEMIKNGQIVPSEVTVGLLQKEMAASGKTHFLIDGFPRNAENRDAFEREMGYDCDMVLFFDCPEAVMEKRLLGRNEGRVDDNIETIRKRFKVFQESSMPVVSYYESLGKVKRIIADKSPEEVYDYTKQFLNSYLKDSVLGVTSKLLASLDVCDWDSYRDLLDPEVTAFDPEAKQQLIEGLPFHKFNFSSTAFSLSSNNVQSYPNSTMANPKITLLGDSALVTYTRLVQYAAPVAFPQDSKSTSAEPQQRAAWWHPAPPPVSVDSNSPAAPVSCGSPTVSSYSESLVWKRADSAKGVDWKLVHFHRS